VRSTVGLVIGDCQLHGERRRRSILRKPNSAVEQLLRWATGRLAAFIESFNSRPRGECLNEHVSSVSPRQARSSKLNEAGITTTIICDPATREPWPIEFTGRPIGTELSMPLKRMHSKRLPPLCAFIKVRRSYCSARKSGDKETKPCAYSTAHWTTILDDQPPQSALETGSSATFFFRSSSSPGMRRPRQGSVSQRCVISSCSR
jgi:hypothetical protein